jgi:3-methylfumaryl-CoA hydratase
MFENCEGESVTRMESCTLAAARRVAAMLDLDPGELVEGHPLPRGWQFILLGADTRKSDLRSDGFPGLGVPMPDLGLPRLLLGGRTVDYCHDIPIGSMVTRVSQVKSLTRKAAAHGDMAVLTIAHELHVPTASTAAIVETQTYILLSSKNNSAESDGMPRAVSAEQSKIVTPDETLLFQYSALGFNSHKIHIDKAYARDVEGFPDLVVNGGLVTLLLTELLRTDLGLAPASFRTKHLAPLFCGRPITLAADRDGSRDGNAWRLRAYNHAGKIAAEMEVHTK